VTNLVFEIAFSKIYIALCTRDIKIYWPHQNKWASFTGRWPRQERLATSVSTDAAVFYDTWLPSIQYTHQMRPWSLCPTKITLKTEGVEGEGMMLVVTQITMFQMLLTCCCHHGFAVLSGNCVPFCRFNLRFIKLTMRKCPYP